MKKLLEIVSYCALILVIAAPVLFYMGQISLDQNKLWMTIATIIWFASASFWIGAEQDEEADDS
ncbi:MAG: hypothetical protein KDA74_06660 [Planctomycetaceae bacterium]|nr:hypothetical protein [Planctomycetaceae bacterium]